MARIAVFSLTFPPFIGGAEVAVERIARQLHATHEFTVFTARLRQANPSFEHLRNGVVIVRVGLGWRLDKYLFPWLAQRAAIRRNQDKPFDLIWGIMASWGGWAALKFKESSRLPYILTEQSGDSDAFIARRTWFWRYRYAQIYTGADRVTAISRFLVQRAERCGARHVVLVPNGVDLQHFGQSIEPGRIAQERQRLGLAPNEKVIVSLSRLVFKNGLDTLIDAVARLSRGVMNVKLVLVGNGPLREKLQAQARRHGVATRVVFKGHQPYPLLPYYLAVADVFVRPSRSEGFGNAFVEAMAAGKPVIGTAVGGIVDFLRDGENGLLVPPDDAERLAAAIGRLLSDAELRARLVANGRVTAQRYDWGTIAQHMGEVFSLLTSSHASTTPGHRG